MSQLVNKLAEGNHPVEVNIRPQKTVEAFKECIERGYLHIKFPNTQGGTELGVRLDGAASDLRGANFDQKSGRVHLVGGLTLDYVKVRCVADINLETLTGNGHLERVDA